MEFNEQINQREISAVLMQLNEAKKLYGLAKDKSPHARSQLAKSISKLLEMDVNERESEMVADVLVDLMRKAESDVRQALADQLSTLDDVPLRLVLQLANDDIDIAKPVLKDSPVLSDLDLVYIIKAKSADYWRVIATREQIGDQVVDMLADTHDYETALNLCENTKIRLTEHAAVSISDMAQDHEDLAMPLLRRSDISQTVVSRLYEVVGQEIKSFIVQNYNIDTQVLIDAVENTVKEFKEGQDFQDYKPEEHMMKAALAMKGQGKLNTKLMLSTLRRGQFRSFVAQFAVFTELDIKTVCEILIQTHGQGLAVASKAFGISKEDFVSMFLLSNQFRNTGRLVDSQAMAKAVTYYERVEPSVALQIIRNSSVH